MYQGLARHPCSVLLYHGTPADPGLDRQRGLSWIGGYVSGAALLSLIAVLCLKETRESDLNRVV
ncbi:hypothetical protein D9M71_269340 [compost metagenome]